MSAGELVARRLGSKSLSHLQSGGEADNPFEYSHYGPGVFVKTAVSLRPREEFGAEARTESGPVVLPVDLVADFMGRTDLYIDLPALNPPEGVLVRWPRLPALALIRRFGLFSAETELCGHSRESYLAMLKTGVGPGRAEALAKMLGDVPALVDPASGPHGATRAPAFRATVPSMLPFSRDHRRALPLSAMHQAPGALKSLLSLRVWLEPVANVLQVWDAEAEQWLPAARAGFSARSLLGRDTDFYVHAKADFFQVPESARAAEGYTLAFSDRTTLKELSALPAASMAGLPPPLCAPPAGPSGASEQTRVRVDLSVISAPIERLYVFARRRDLLERGLWSHTGLWEDPAEAESDAPDAPVRAVRLEMDGVVVLEEDDTAHHGLAAQFYRGLGGADPTVLTLEFGVGYPGMVHHGLLPAEGARRLDLFVDLPALDDRPGGSGFEVCVVAETANWVRVTDGQLRKWEPDPKRFPVFRPGRSAGPSAQRAAPASAPD